MENNMYENNPTPVNEEEQPLQQPVATENILIAKAKEVYENRGQLLNMIKSVSWKVWAIAGAGVVALIAIIVALSISGNTYKTPIQNVEKLLNMKSIEDIVDKAPTLLNGFCEKDAEKLLKILKKSDVYDETMKDVEDGFEEFIEIVEDEFGSDYKIQLKVDDKDALEKDDLEDFEDQLHEIEDLAEQLEDADYDDIADELEITRSQAKDMVKIIENFCKKCESAKITAGYELTLIVSITGDEVDDPEEEDINVNVLKVDGRWVIDVVSLISNRNLQQLIASML